MAGNHQGQIWDQDAITATALGFAGMAILQSKLVPAFSGIHQQWLHKLLQWHVLEYWPVLLIAGGVVVWLVQVVEKRSHRRIAPVADMGGRRGTRTED